MTHAPRIASVGKQRTSVFLIVILAIACAACLVNPESSRVVGLMTLLRALVQWFLSWFRTEGVQRSRMMLMSLGTTAALCQT